MFYNSKIEEEVAFDKSINTLSEAEISILYWIRSSLPNVNECEDKRLVVFYKENLVFENESCNSNNKSISTKFVFEKREYNQYKKQGEGFKLDSDYRWFLVQIDDRILNNSNSPK